MAEGVGFPFTSLPLNEGRTYGQPEVVRISLPQVATGLRLRLPGSFRRRGFQPDLLMPQEALFARGAHSMQAVMHRALLHRGRSGRYHFLLRGVLPAGNQCRIRQKGGNGSWRCDEKRRNRQDQLLHFQERSCLYQFDDVRKSTAGMAERTC